MMQPLCGSREFRKEHAISGKLFAEGSFHARRKRAVFKRNFRHPLHF
jgi:hypothetical protein